MATLNQNPLINNNADNVPSLVLAHNKNISSIFNVKATNQWKIDNLFSEMEIKMEDDTRDTSDCDVIDEFTPLEIFEMIRGINDPEHPLTLEQLAVVKLEDIIINKQNRNKVLVNYTPTIPHCSMATLIGLSIRVKLLRSLPDRFKVKIKITPNTHQSEKEINKQLNDKERVAAALENYALIQTVNQCIKTSLT